MKISFNNDSGISAAPKINRRMEVEKKSVSLTTSSNIIMHSDNAVDHLESISCSDIIKNNNFNDRNKKAKMNIFYVEEDEDVFADNSGDGCLILFGHPYDARTVVQALSMKLVSLISGGCELRGTLPLPFTVSAPGSHNEVSFKSKNFNDNLLSYSGNADCSSFFLISPLGIDVASSLNNNKKIVAHSADFGNLCATDRLTTSFADSEGDGTAAAPVVNFSPFPTSIPRKIRGTTGDIKGHNNSVGSFHRSILSLLNTHTTRQATRCFQKGKLLGAGADGKVFKAYDIDSGMCVALKEMFIAYSFFEKKRHVNSITNGTKSSRSNGINASQVFMQNHPHQKQQIQQLQEAQLLKSGDFGGGQNFQDQDAHFEDYNHQNVSKEEAHFAFLRRQLETLKLLPVHPNLVKHLNTERTTVDLHIFMEYLCGGSLASVLRKIKKPLSEPTIRYYARLICRGLAFLHKFGITHQDIKGANCLLGKGGALKLVDFESCSIDLDVFYAEKEMWNKKKGLRAERMKKTLENIAEWVQSKKKMKVWDENEEGMGKNNNGSDNTSLSIDPGGLQKELELLLGSDNYETYYTPETVNKYGQGYLKGKQVDEKNEVNSNENCGSTIVHQEQGKQRQNKKNQYTKTTGPIRGTSMWMPPECILQEAGEYPVGPQSDIWSLGCTIIEMATCRPPWYGCNFTNTWAAMFHIAQCGHGPPIPCDSDPHYRDLLEYTCDGWGCRSASMTEDPTDNSSEPGAVMLLDTCVDFLNKCFRINPEERMTAAECLQHPFLKNHEAEDDAWTPFCDEGNDDYYDAQCTIVLRGGGENTQRREGALGRDGAFQERMINHLASTFNNVDNISNINVEENSVKLVRRVEDLKGDAEDEAQAGMVLPTDDTLYDFSSVLSMSFEEDGSYSNEDEDGYTFPQYFHQNQKQVIHKHYNNVNIDKDFNNTEKHIIIDQNEAEEGDMMVINTYNSCCEEVDDNIDDIEHGAATVWGGCINVMNSIQGKKTGLSKKNSENKNMAKALINGRGRKDKMNRNEECLKLQHERELQKQEQSYNINEFIDNYINKNTSENLLGKSIDITSICDEDTTFDSGKPYATKADIEVLLNIVDRYDRMDTQNTIRVRQQSILTQQTGEGWTMTNNNVTAQGGNISSSNNVNCKTRELEENPTGSHFSMGSIARIPLGVSVVFTTGCMPVNNNNDNNNNNKDFENKERYLFANNSYFNNTNHAMTEAELFSSGKWMSGLSTSAQLCLLQLLKPQPQLEVSPRGAVAVGIEATQGGDGNRTLKLINKCVDYHSDSACILSSHTFLPDQEETKKKSRMESKQDFQQQQSHCFVDVSHQRGQYSLLIERQSSISNGISAKEMNSRETSLGARENSVRASTCLIGDEEGSSTAIDDVIEKNKINSALSKDTISSLLCDDRRRISNTNAQFAGHMPAPLFTNQRGQLKELLSPPKPFYISKTTTSEVAEPMKMTLPTTTTSSQSINMGNCEEKRNRYVSMQFNNHMDAECLFEQQENVLLERVHVTPILTEPLHISSQSPMTSVNFFAVTPSFLAVQSINSFSRIDNDSLVYLILSYLDFKSFCFMGATCRYLYNVVDGAIGDLTSNTSRRLLLTLKQNNGGGSQLMKMNGNVEDAYDQEKKKESFKGTTVTRDNADVVTAKPTTILYNDITNINTNNQNKRNNNNSFDNITNKSIRDQLWKDLYVKDFFDVDMLWKTTKQVKRLALLRGWGVGCNRGGSNTARALQDHIFSTNDNVWKYFYQTSVKISKELGSYILSGIVSSTVLASGNFRRHTIPHMGAGKSVTSVALAASPFKSMECNQPVHVQAPFISLLRKTLPCLATAVTPPASNRAHVAVADSIFLSRLPTESWESSSILKSEMVNPEGFCKRFLNRSFRPLTGVKQLSSPFVAGWKSNTAGGAVAMTCGGLSSVNGTGSNFVSLDDVNSMGATAKVGELEVESFGQEEPKIIVRPLGDREDVYEAILVFKVKERYLDSFPSISKDVQKEGASEHDLTRVSCYESKFVVKIEHHNVDSPQAGFISANTFVRGGIPAAGIPSGHKLNVYSPEVSSLVTSPATTQKTVHQLTNSAEDHSTNPEDFLGSTGDASSSGKLNYQFRTPIKDAFNNRAFLTLSDGSTQIQKKLSFSKTSPQSDSLPPKCSLGGLTPPHAATPAAAITTTVGGFNFISTAKHSYQIFQDVHNAQLQSPGSINLLSPFPCALLHDDVIGSANNNVDQVSAADSLLSRISFSPQGDHPTRAFFSSANSSLGDDITFSDRGHATPDISAERSATASFSVHPSIVTTTKTKNGHNKSPGHHWNKGNVDNMLCMHDEEPEPREPSEQVEVGANEGCYLSDLTMDSNNGSRQRGGPFCSVSSRPFFEELQANNSDNKKGGKLTSRSEVRSTASLISDNNNYHYNKCTTIARAPSYKNINVSSILSVAPPNETTGVANINTVMQQYNSSPRGVLLSYLDSKSNHLRFSMRASSFQLETPGEGGDCMEGYGSSGIIGSASGSPIVVARNAKAVVIPTLFEYPNHFTPRGKGGGGRTPEFSFTTPSDRQLVSPAAWGLAFSHAVTAPDEPCFFAMNDGKGNHAGRKGLKIVDVKGRDVRRQSRLEKHKPPSYKRLDNLEIATAAACAAKAFCGSLPNVGFLSQNDSSHFRAIRGKVFRKKCEDKHDCHNSDSSANSSFSPCTSLSKPRSFHSYSPHLVLGSAGSTPSRNSEGMLGGDLPEIQEMTLPPSYLISNTKNSNFSNNIIKNDEKVLRDYHNPDNTYHYENNNINTYKKGDDSGLEDITYTNNNNSNNKHVHNNVSTSKDIFVTTTKPKCFADLLLSPHKRNKNGQVCTEAGITIHAKTPPPPSSPLTSSSLLYPCVSSYLGKRTSRVMDAIHDAQSLAMTNNKATTTTNAILTTINKGEAFPAGAEGAHIEQVSCSSSDGRIVVTKRQVPRVLSLDESSLRDACGDNIFFSEHFVSGQSMESQQYSFGNFSQQKQPPQQQQQQQQIKIITTPNNNNNIININKQIMSPSLPGTHLAALGAGMHKSYKILRVTNNGGNINTLPTHTPKNNVTSNANKSTTVMAPISTGTAADAAASSIRLTTSTGPHEITVEQYLKSMEMTPGTGGGGGANCSPGGKSGGHIPSSFSNTGGSRSSLNHEYKVLKHLQDTGCPCIPGVINYLEIVHKSMKGLPGGCGTPSGLSEGMMVSSDANAAMSGGASRGLGSVENFPFYRRGSDVFSEGVGGTGEGLLSYLPTTAPLRERIEVTYKDTWKELALAAFNSFWKFKKNNSSSGTHLQSNNVKNVSTYNVTSPHTPPSHAPSYIPLSSCISNNCHNSFVGNNSAASMNAFSTTTSLHSREIMKHSPPFTSTTPSGAPSSPLQRPQLSPSSHSKNVNILIMTSFGPNLRDLLQSCGNQFSLATSLKLLIKLCEALCNIHERDVVHGAISPRNVVMGNGCPQKRCIALGQSNAEREVFEKGKGDCNGSSGNNVQRKGAAMGGGLPVSSSGGDFLNLAAMTAKMLMDGSPMLGNKGNRRNTLSEVVHDEAGILGAKTSSHCTSPISLPQSSSRIYLINFCRAIFYRHPKTHLINCALSTGSSSRQSTPLSHSLNKLSLNVANASPFSVQNTYVKTYGSKPNNEEDCNRKPPMSPSNPYLLSSTADCSPCEPVVAESRPLPSASSFPCPTVAHNSEREQQWFSSPFVQQGCISAPRDDMISALYVAVFLITGTLPWIITSTGDIPRMVANRKIALQRLQKNKRVYAKSSGLRKKKKTGDECKEEVRGNGLLGGGGIENNKAAATGKTGGASRIRGRETEMMGKGYHNSVRMGEGCQTGGNIPSCIGALSKLTKAEMIALKMDLPDYIEFVVQQQEKKKKNNKNDEMQRDGISNISENNHYHADTNLFSSVPIELANLLRECYSLRQTQIPQYAAYIANLLKVVYNLYSQTSSFACNNINKTGVASTAINDLKTRENIKQKVRDFLLFMDIYDWENIPINGINGINIAQEESECIDSFK